MTDEQKKQLMMELAKSGANISQINFGDGTQNFYIGKGKEEKSEFACEAVVVNAEVVDDIELCHFIHPAVTDDKEKLQIHREIGNLVTHYQAQDICNHLNSMAAAGKILLPQSLESAMPELHRMGMPDESVEGFARKTLYKYYRK